MEMAIEMAMEMAIEMAVGWMCSPSKGSGWLPASPARSYLLLTSFVLSYCHLLYWNDMPHLFLIPSLIIHILGRCIYMELPISFPYITLMYICILFLHYSSPYSQGKILFDISFKNWYNSVLLCPINCKMPFADVLLQTVLSP